MGAQPKNKITRVEQGKRRAGNTPTLVKDATFSQIPLHKRGFFAKFTALVGGKATLTKNPVEKSEKTAANASTQMKAAASVGQRKGAHPMAKKNTRTQHKGA
jgi:hypothetical protein